MQITATEARVPWPSQFGCATLAHSSPNFLRAPMTLLTVAFLVTSLLGVIAQDAAALASPVAPPPGETPQEAPEHSSGEALELLARAQARLYDIRAAGLESLSFAVPIRMGSPTGETLHLGDVAVNWTVSADPEVVVTVSDSLPDELARQATAIEYQLEAQGRQILRFVDNDIFQGLLDGFDPTSVDQDGELTRVHFEPHADQVGAPGLDWYFDAQDVPVKFAMTVTQGDMSMNISYEHGWAPVSGTNNALVLERLSIVQEMGPMRNVITTSLDHDTISGVVILVGYTERGLTPEGEATTNAVLLEGLSLTTKEGN